MIWLEDALRLVERSRGDAVVVACQSARFTWAAVTRRPELDIPFSDCMGKGSSLGLGIAMARPDRDVIVLDGDGSLLMNLGSLVTVAGQSPRNFRHFVVQNGVYRGSGGQPIPGHRGLSFADLARAAGYTASYEFSDLEELALDIDDIFATDGPVFVCLKVEPAAAEQPAINPDEAPTLKDGIELVRSTLAGS